MPFTRVGRLARRSPRYLAWRLAQEARRETDRLALALALRGSGPVGSRAVRRVLDGGALRSTRQAVSALGSWSEAATHIAREPLMADTVKRRAARAHAGHVEAFGDAPLELERPLPWTSDPRAGYRFPDGFHRHIDYRLIDRRCDVKVAWEISRLRVVVELGQGVALDGDPRLEPTLLEDVASWSSTNPVGYTVNWAVAMEVALRATNLICLDGLLGVRGADDRARAPLVSLLYRHGWFLARNLEVGDLNGNHFLADAVGLTWLGHYFAGHGEAGAWLARGRSMVREAAREQVLSDGLDHEGSLRYHVLVLELLLMAIAVEKEPGEVVVDAARSMTDALVAVTGPDGRVPDLGDDDGGRALALSATPSWDARRVLALAAVLCAHPAAAAVAGADDRLWEDALWLCGPRAVREAQHESGPLPASPTYLREGGIVVLGEGDDHVTVDVGPTGFRGRGGHGHLDALSFEAVLDGRLVVRDSGTGSYTGDVELREELRDATAHSVVIVDGRRYARLGGTARLWSIDGDAPPAVLTLDRTSAHHRLVAEQRLPAEGGKCVWRRELVWSPGRLVCRDVVRAPPGAEVEHHLQLPAGDVPVERLGAPTASRVELVDVRWSDGYGKVRVGSRLTTRWRQGDAEAELAFVVTA